MNKTKMMLTVTGGTMGLAVLVMAYFTWSAFSAKTVALEGDDDEGTAGLETVLSRAQMLSRKPIYPCAESLEAIESNRTVLADWRSEATKLCVRGDRLFEKTTPAAFKEFLVSDAKRLAALPGRANGVLVKPDFSFGPFKNYISGGMMPAESELATLQRKWDDVSTIIEILARSGIAELTGITEKERSEVNGQGAEVKGQRSKVKGNKQSKNRKIEKSKIFSPSSLLSLVGLDETALDKYPHAFSGGERQRLCIARALATEPDLLICDEAVSALDLSIRSQVLELLTGLKEKFGLSLLFISHDLGVVQHMADWLLVMNRGKKAEEGPCGQILRAPQEEYTKLLVSSVPKIGKPLT